MGYFSNGTEGMAYTEHYCSRCVNDKNDDCPILALHLLWNYDQHDNTDKKLALDSFIPRSADGLSNEQCKMFRPKQTRQKSKQMKLGIPAETNAKT